MAFAFLSPARIAHVCVAVVLLTSLWASNRSHALELISGVDTPTASGDLLVLDPGLGTDAQPIPKPWEDNSAWADLDVDYSVDSFEGVPHLRVNCTRLRSGRVQLAAKAPDLKPGELYRLSFEARAPDSAAILVRIQAAQSPYTSYWATPFNIGTRFAQYDAIVAIDEMSAGAWFMLVMEETGALDIRNVTLRKIETLSDEDLGPPRNLTRNSRFPLGMPDTSMIWRTIPDSKIKLAADPSVVGPTGSPALHAKSPEGETLRFDGDLFIVHRRLSEHHAQFMAKGSGTVQFSVVADGETLREESFELSADWAPIGMSFKPKPSSDLHLCRWKLKGEMWIDQMIINAGEEAIDYASQPRHEVALDLVRSDASIAHIQFEDEPAQLQWAVTGTSDAPTFIEAKLFHVDGSEMSLDRITLEGSEFLEQGVLDLELWPDRTFGTFRLEARVIDAEANPLSPWAEIVWHRVMRPRYWGKDAPDSAFGAHLNSTERHITMAKAIGVNWVRLHDSGSHINKWIELEPEPGQWNFADDDLYRYRDGQLKVLGLFSTAPKWASHYQTRTQKQGGSNYFDQFFLPLNPEKDYANYVATVAERYKGVIDAYEVWNEPWQIRWFGVDFKDGKYVHPDDPHAEYARLTKIASQTAKAIDPNIKIVGLNTGHTTRNDEYAVSSVEWSKGVVDAGGLDYADAASVHVYKNDPGGYPDSAVDQALAHGVGPNELMDRIETPVWMTEGSSTYTKLAMGFYNRSLPNPVLDTNERLAEGVLRYHVTMLSRNVERIFLYAMHVGSIRNSSAFSSLISRDASLHPSAIAHANLAWHVEDMDYHSVHEISPKVWLYVWQMEGRSAAVVLPQETSVSYTLDTSLLPEVRNIWGNPLSGSVDVTTSGVLINAPAMTADQLIQRFIPENKIPALKDHSKAEASESNATQSKEKQSFFRRAWNKLFGN